MHETSEEHFCIFFRAHNNYISEHVDVFFLFKMYIMYFFSHSCTKRNTLFVSETARKFLWGVVGVLIFSY